MNNILVYIILFLSAVSSYAGEIFVKHTGAVTELFLNIDKSVVKDYKVNDNSVSIEFKKVFSLKLDNIKDNLIASIEQSGNRLLVKFSANVKGYAALEDKGIRIVAAPSAKKNDNVLNVNIENQMSNTDAKSNKNPAAETALKNLLNIFNSKDYPKAVSRANDLIKKYGNSNYAQEAYFIMGSAYMAMGSGNEKNYFQASDIFDDFIKKFPNNPKIAESYMKSGEAKEKLGFNNEAIAVYKTVVTNYPNTELASNAYMQIGNIYEKLGQWDNALLSYKDYLEKTNKHDKSIFAAIASIYAQKKDYNVANDFFSKYLNASNGKFTELPPKTIFVMGNVFEQKGEHQKALNAFNTLISLYPDYEENDMAMVKSADILMMQDKKKIAENLMLDTKEKYPTKKGGVIAALKYAENNLKDNNYEYWKTFLKEATVFNEGNIPAKANYLLIKSMINDKKYNDASEAISKFDTLFPQSEYSKELLNFREDILYNNIKKAVEGGKSDVAALISKLNKEFPSTKYKNDINILNQDIEYNKAKSLYNAKKYADSLSVVEKFLSANKEIIHPEKWFKLWEDSKYNYINILKNSGKKENYLAHAKEFISNFPKSTQRNNEMVTSIVKQYESEAMNMIKSKNNVMLAAYYDQNREWLDKSHKKNEIVINSSYALYKIGEKDKSKKIFDTAKDDGSQMYAILKVLFSGNAKIDLNKMNDEGIQLISSEISKNNPMKAYEMLEGYTKNNALKRKLQHDTLLKLNKSEYEKEISKFYDKLKSDSDAIKKQNSEIFYTYGNIAYNTGNFNKAAEAFGLYIKLVPDSEQKKAEALFFAGKSYIKKNDDANGIKMYEELIKKYPTTQYASIAKSDIGDISWKKKFKN